MKKALISLSALMAVLFTVSAQNRPYGLRTDLIERTDVVYLNGYATSMTLEEIPLAVEPVQCAAICSQKPRFSWIVDGGGQSDVEQEAYRIEVYRFVPAEKNETVRQVVWDSGKVMSPKSTSVEYGGAPLDPDTVYYWSVTTWTTRCGESMPSEAKAFRTAHELNPYAISTEPIIKTDRYPVLVKELEGGNTFIDFGKDAFGQLRVTLNAANDGDKVVLHLGERLRDGRVDRTPFGTCRYRRIELTLRRGTNTYLPKILPDHRNTHGDAVLMPDYIGEVMPFRYMEIEGLRGGIAATDIVRMDVHHPFDDYASSFECSDVILNQVWDLCKYSMKATSFIGYHIDGDRERIPYECDALINQLCCYGTDNGYTLSRRTVQYLLDHPTWPTEWILQTVLMAWNDYLYTGDDRLLAERYDILCNHTLNDLKGECGLISTRVKAQEGAFLAGINRKEKIRDIVDWPQGKGSFGLPDSHPGEADFFEFTDYNAVVNAYHFKTLEIMHQVALTLGKAEDAARWQAEAESVRKQFNKLLLDTRNGRYRDGVGSEHSALHSNMFPLAFGLVPANKVSGVADFVRSRGMACSIANAMFLLDGLYEAYQADYALSLMTATHDRGWYNTILSGSTMTFEAWDDKYKGNQDWNHAWGAAPASAIPHKLLGVEPLAPGWDKIRIRPQIADLDYAEGVVPTIKGPVTVKVTKDSESYNLYVEIPANTKARIYLPAGPKGKVTLDGTVIKAVKDPTRRFFIIEDAGSGRKTYSSL